MTFLQWMQAEGPWVLVACNGDSPTEARLCGPHAAANFLASHARRGRIVRVLLGEPDPNFRYSKGLPPILASRYVALAFSPDRAKELEARARPPILIDAHDHSIAAWRISPAAAYADALAAIRTFGLEFGAKVLPDALPVPFRSRLDKTRFRPGEFVCHAFRADRDAIVWDGKLQFARGTIKKDATQGGRLKQALEEFGVKAEVVSAQSGPVITSYDLELGRGVKVDSVIKLSRDLARAMKCKSARIVDATEKGGVTVEIPNARRETVLLRDLFEADAFKRSRAALALAIGKSVNGEAFIADLAEMPHLMLAGATGSGKSVGLNAMILSLICKLGPDRCNFIMIDPKELELSVYAKLPHMLAPVVTEPEKAVRVLQWLIREMRQRNKAMSEAGVRNVAGYNSKRPSARLPRIVVIIDEVADLMMVAGDEIDAAIQRLAQMARAAGIHIIMATQRPSVDVITGVIKANFPSRIAYAVASVHDSKTIINEGGAEYLLGKGDMLYMTNGEVRRAHGPFVSDDEVAAEVRKHENGGTHYREDLMAILATGGEAEPITAFQPKPTLSAAVMRHIAVLQDILTPGGPPINQAEVKRAIEARGLTIGSTFQKAVEALRIHVPAERDGEPVTRSKLMTPPSEWPPEFDLTLG